jgi:hypothetical protein
VSTRGSSTILGWDYAAFAGQAEEAISREHTLWSDGDGLRREHLGRDPGNLLNAGVSFRTVHDPDSDTTHTVIANWSNGAWPVTRALDQMLLGW